MQKSGIPGCCCRPALRLRLRTRPAPAGLRGGIVEREAAAEKCKRDERNSRIRCHLPECRRHKMFIAHDHNLNGKPIYGRHTYLAPKGAGSTKSAAVSINIAPLSGSARSPLRTH